MRCGLSVLQADLTTRHTVLQAARLQCLRHRLAELLVSVDNGEPEAVIGGVRIAGASSVTFNEWYGSELLHAGTGRL